MSDDLLLVRTALKSGIRLRQALVTTCAADIVRCASLIREAFAGGHKLLLCGNGGSAADAQHIAAELVGRFAMERAGLPAIALTTDTSALTAIANDYGYEAVFARQVEALGQSGDVLIAITTSGQSPNVLRAIDVARQRGMKVIAWTGARGAALVERCDAGVAVPSNNTARIQECHIAIGHALCELVEAEPRAQRVSRPKVVDLVRSPKLYTLPALCKLRERCRAARQTVAWTNGVFDVLHVGHLHSLRAARAYGDLLFVGINSDATVRAAKGPNRPIFPVAERVEMLAALEVVDAILVFHEPDPVRVLSALKPDVHVKGADYAPPHGKPIPEAGLVRDFGGRVEFVPLVPGRSSTETLSRLLAES